MFSNVNRREYSLRGVRASKITKRRIKTYLNREKSLPDDLIIIFFFYLIIKNF